MCCENIKFEKVNYKTDTINSCNKKFCFNSNINISKLINNHNSLAFIPKG